VVWTTRVCCPTGSLAWASDRAGLDSVQTKRSGSGLGLKPNRPKVCLLRVCLAKHALMP
jgi:hypothetical protein